MPTQSAAKTTMGSQIKQKENLNWKINLLAAQLGGKSRISRANVAAKSLVKDGESSNVDEEAIKKQLLELKAQKINMKLFHVNKEIKKLMKKAKNSEIQRMVKKSKTAKAALESDEKTEGKEDAKDTESKVDEELAMLKSMNLDLVATTATRNKISKHRSIKNSNILSMLEFPTDEATKIQNDISPENAKLQHNIEARLLNFKPIKEEFSKLLEDIEKVMEAGSHVPEAVVDKTNASEDNDMEVEEEEDEEKAVVDAPPTKRKAVKSDSSDKATSTPKKPKANKKETDASSTFVSTLYSDSEEEEEEKPKKKKKSSDDNWVDENFDKYYGKEKKNRPSQRRRREMYEKLYGEEANHVKAQLEAQKAKDERKLARQMKKSASGGNSASLGKRRSNASNPSQPAKAKASTEQLHPSWEAKKHQQDLMAKALSGAGGLGNKKIVFDDSD
ncbi:unnamed protein product [Umbelopsis ramanniana]